MGSVNGGLCMLILSFILAGSLEAALSCSLYISTGHVPWIYVLLLASTLLSIPIELSEEGETIRKELKKAGTNIDLYDITENIGRAICYLAVWDGMIDPDTGGVLACLCVGLSLLVATFRQRM